MLRPRLHKQPIRNFATDVAVHRQVAQHHTGIRPIPIACVVGSVGRAHELRSNFMFQRRSRRRSDHHRYRALRAFMEWGGTVPPIHAYHLDGLYYVLDEHRRVAVARSLGQLYIDAVVVEIQPLGHWSHLGNPSHDAARLQHVA
ncbi:MAG: hypothetical protein NVS2B16_29940 [Chloroflexota bacterium]